MNNIYKILTVLCATMIAFVAGSLSRPATPSGPSDRDGASRNAKSRVRHDRQEQNANRHRTVEAAALSEWARLEKLSKLSQQEVLEALEAASSMEQVDWDSRLLLRRAVEMEGKAAISWALEKYDIDTTITERLISSWSREDPEGTAAELIELMRSYNDTLRGTENRLHLIDFGGFAENDPEGALKTYRSLPPEWRTHATKGLLQGLMKSAPTRALSMLDQRPAGASFGTISRYDWGRIAEANPDALLAWVNDRDEPPEDNILLGVAAGIAEKDPTNALLLIKKFRDPQASLDRNTLSTFAYKVGSGGNFREACDLVKTYARVRDQPEVMEGYFKSGLFSEPHATVELLFDQPELLKYAPVKSLIRGFETAGRVDDLRKLVDSSEDPELRAKLRAALIKGGHMRLQGDMLADPEAGGHLADAFGEVLTYEPERALQVWEMLSPETKERFANDYRTRSKLEGALERLPASSLRQLADHESGELAPTINGLLVERLARSDFQSAATEVDNRPPGTVSDSAIRYLIEEWSYADPVEAHSWREPLED